jgi:hypothetical protein
MTVAMNEYELGMWFANGLFTINKLWCIKRNCKPYLPCFCKELLLVIFNDMPAFRCSTHLKCSLCFECQESGIWSLRRQLQVQIIALGEIYYP